jgi:hypothetical protein
MAGPCHPIQGCPAVPAHYTDRHDRLGLIRQRMYRLPTPSGEVTGGLISVYSQNPHNTRRLRVDHSPATHRAGHA